MAFEHNVSVTEQTSNTRSQPSSTRQPRRPPVRPLNDLARTIDAASDAADESLLRILADECEDHLVNAEGQDRVFLRYFQSNAYAAIISAKHRDPNYAWSWQQPERIQSLLLLRRATNEPSFSYIDPITASQVRTNLANGLNSVGRIIAANEQWVTTLRAVPRFAKAFANRAQGLAYFARTVYDHGHAAVLLAAARASYDSALSEDAFWESDDRKIVAPQLTEERQQIASLLSRIQYDDDFDLNQWSLGSTATERSYRSWCLRECLFLNPLNEACTSSVAATDILHLPNHSYKIGEAPRFPAYYNIMKQEYIGARYRLFCAIHKDDPNFIMRDVLMLDSGEGQCLGHYTEDLRSSFRGAYSIFDKIALFMNDYYHLGLRPKAVTFKGIWFERTNSASQSVRSIFNSRQNLPLRGLYFLIEGLA